MTLIFGFFTAILCPSIPWVLVGIVVDLVTADGLRKRNGNDYPRRSILAHLLIIWLWLGYVVGRVVGLFEDV